MLCPNRNLLVSIPILTGVNGSQRTRPFLAPFLQCSFCQMHQHQFVCDPIVTNSEVHTLQCEKKSSTDHRPVSGKGGSRQQQQQHPAVLSTFLINHPIRLLTHPYLLLAYLAFVAYWPSLWADLVFDDRPAIVENKDLRPDTHWSRVWFDDFWGTPLKSVSLKGSVFLSCSPSPNGLKLAMNVRYRIIEEWKASVWLFVFC